MTHKDLTALALRATEETLDMLERLLRHPCADHGLGEDPATRTVLLATDQLAFALVRYRAEHAMPQR